MLICPLAHSQEANDLFNRTVTLSTQSVRLDTLLQTITRQTGIRFSYNSRRLNTAYKLSLPEKKLSVADVLHELRKRTGVSYLRVENQLILNVEKSTIQKNTPSKPRAGNANRPTALTPSPPQPKKSEILQTELIVDNKNPIDSTSSDRAELISVPSDALITRTDSAALPATDSTQQIVAQATNLKTDIVRDRVDPESSKKVTLKRSNLFVDVGITTEETAYLGATIRAGTPTFFGTLTVKSNGRAAILMYGLSGGFNNGSRSRILLNTSFGTYTKSFEATTVSIDSINTTHTIAVSGIWATVNAGVEWKLSASGSWKLFAGLSFNALESKYRVDGKNQSVTGMPGVNREARYAAFYPPYTLSNGYNDTVFQSVKTWLGFQVGIYRKIFSR